MPPAALLPLDGVYHAMPYREEDLIFSPEQFTGRVRLFPLPNLVLFPHVIQPLRVFERRYVDLLHDALQTDRLIAMSLLQPGWENDYDGRPPIAPVACLGRVLTWQSQPKMQYNLLLVGLRRVRIESESPPEQSFRQAQASILDDVYPSSSAGDRAALHRELNATFESLLPDVEDSAEMLNQVAAKNISLGALTDVISYALDLDVQVKQALLEEPDVDCRARVLLGHLRGTSCEAAQRHEAAGFPPTFSVN